MTETETTQAAPSAPAETPTETTDLTVNHDAVEKTETTPTTTEQPETPVTETGETDETVEKKKPTGSQRLKRKLSLVEAEFLELQRQNEELRQRVETATPSRDGKPGIDREPTEADYPNDYFAYQSALTAWTTRQAVREELGRREQVQRQSNQDRARVEYREERIDVLNEGAATARERIPDFDKVVNSATAVQLSNELADEILASDKSALLQYHLAKNPDTVRELNRMNGRELAREIGRLEARIHLPQPKKATQATPPPSQPRGGASPPVNLMTAEMDAYVAERKRQGFA